MGDDWLDATEFALDNLPPVPEEPARISGDGKFFWDGKRWAPIEEMPPPPPPGEAAAARVPCVLWPTAVAACAVAGALLFWLGLPGS